MSDKEGNWIWIGVTIVVIVIILLWAFMVFRKKPEPQSSSPTFRVEEPSSIVVPDSVIGGGFPVSENEK